MRPERRRGNALQQKEQLVLGRLALHPRIPVTQNSHKKVGRPKVAQCTHGTSFPVFG